jgi:Ca2+-binding RTX toxin-like protein
LYQSPNDSAEVDFGAKTLFVTRIENPEYAAGYAPGQKWVGDTPTPTDRSSGTHYDVPHYLYTVAIRDDASGHLTTVASEVEGVAWNRSGKLVLSNYPGTSYATGTQHFEIVTAGENEEEHRWRFEQFDLNTTTTLIDVLSGQSRTISAQGRATLLKDDQPASVDGEGYTDFNKIRITFDQNASPYIRHAVGASYETTESYLNISEATIDVNVDASDLFSENVDIVDFNKLTDGQKTALEGTDFYKALNGDDIIILPNKDKYQFSPNVQWKVEDPAFFETGGGNDTVTGGNGNDRIRGNEGDDTIIASPGDDILWGDDGNDIFDFQKADLTKAGGHYAAVTSQTISGGKNTSVVGGGGDTLKLPFDPSQYSVDIDFGVTWEDTKTTIVFESAAPVRSTHVDLALSVYGVERVAFANSFSNAVHLTGNNVIEEMARLSKEVYGPQPTLSHPAEKLPSEAGWSRPLTHGVADRAEARGWHPVSALELGILPGSFLNDPNVSHPVALGSSTLNYTFVNGHYQAVDSANASRLQPANQLLNQYTGGDLPEANALVLTGVVNGKNTLTVAFRGTDQISDFGDYINFHDHYAKYKPLISGIQNYLTSHPEIEQVYITGHSLGAGMVQYLMAEPFMQNRPVKAYTFGSPGSDAPITPNMQGNLINFVHTDDAVPLATLATTPLGKAAIAALGTVAGAQVGVPGAVFAAGVLTPLAVSAQQKVRGGTDILLSSDYSPEPVPGLDEHDAALYLTDMGKLRTFSHDPTSPFYGTGLAEHFRTGSPYGGGSMKIGMGSPHYPLTHLSAEGTVYGVGTGIYVRTVFPTAGDNFVLADRYPNIITMRSAEIEAKVAKRVIDGGDGSDTIQFQKFVSRGDEFSVDADDINMKFMRDKSVVITWDKPFRVIKSKDPDLPDVVKTKEVYVATLTDVEFIRYSNGDKVKLAPPKKGRGAESAAIRDDDGDAGLAFAQATPSSDADWLLFG